MLSLRVVSQLEEGMTRLGRLKASPMFYRLPIALRATSVYLLMSIWCLVMLLCWLLSRSCLAHTVR